MVNKMVSNSKQVNVDDVVFSNVLQVLRKHGSRTWTGTMTELSAALTKTVGKQQSSVLPGSPSALRVVLNRVVNRLRYRKISVKFARTTDHMRTRYVKFTR
jgi:hypothetical protein